MRACIHRGAKEIGGSCVELEHDGARLVLDVGKPLGVGLDEVVPLPSVEGLASGAPGLVGLVVSHGHPDHYGLAGQVHPSVPLYLGEATQRILSEAAFFSPAGAQLHPTGFLRDREPLEIGPFRVTPFLTDHSAFDAYSLLVEAGGRRLFYSGDLRAHGRKARLVERLIASPPSDIGTLILEGTSIRSDGTPPNTLSESDVEDECVKLFRATERMILACYSGQNIDRLVTFYRAAKRSGRKLVIDLYGAAIAQATGRPETIPQSDWDGVRVFVPLSQRIRVKESREFARTGAVRANRLYPEDLADAAAGLVMTFRGSMARDLERAGCLAGAHAVWSMWPGYLDEPSGERTRAWLKRNDVPLAVLHSSGHATTADLQRLAAALDAQQVVPIHTSAPEMFADLLDRVHMRKDGAWWPV